MQGIKRMKTVTEEESEEHTRLLVVHDIWILLVFFAVRSMHVIIYSV